MFLFSKKELIAELKIGLTDNNKVFISIKNIPVNNGKEMIEIFKKSQLPIVFYMYFFDLVLINMRKDVSVATLNSIYQYLLQCLNKIRKTTNENEWLEERNEFNTLNKWIFTGIDNDFVEANFKTTAKIFLKDKRFFCEADFDKNKLIEAYAYLLLESLLIYIIQKMSYKNCAYDFLPALLAQCTFYDNKRPKITEIGKAVNFGLKKAEEARKRFNVNFDD